MNNLPAVISTDNLPAVAGAVESAKGYIQASAADNTQRAYRIQWGRFAAWCEAAGVQALPAEPGTAAAYFAALADTGKKAATIDTARAAIRKVHETAGFTDCTAAPLVKQTLKGIRREKGTAQVQKSPLLTIDLRRLVTALPDTLKGKRDKAILLLGFATGSRRSELVGLQVEDIEETLEGVILTIRKSKTDQEGKGLVKGIARGMHPETCPVSALSEWISAAGIDAGPVFRHVAKGGKLAGPLSAQSVALIVKDTCRKAKLDEKKYSGHSLRAGLVTQAAKNGVQVADIMRQTGHRSTETVARYVRKANLFEDNASAALGL